jgi:signal recognition particle subunit SRP54
MIPGVGKALKDVDMDNSSFKSIEAIIQSMTKDEKNDPSILNGNRRKRIASGSGTSIAEVNRLVKQFEDMRKVMKNMAGGGAKNAMRNMASMRRR